MVPNADILPVRGQWAFCHAVFPGKIFAAGRSAWPGQHGHARRHRVAKALVFGTGWMADGHLELLRLVLRPRLALARATGRKAAEMLYAFANHASPLLAWREEQTPSARASRSDDRGRHAAQLGQRRVHPPRPAPARPGARRRAASLEGLPRTWLFPEAETALTDVATDFGPVSFRLKVSSDGRTAAFEITPPESPTLQKVVVHLGAWAGEAEVKTARKDRVMRFEIPLVR